MKDSFVKYLKTLGITEPLQERIETIYGFFREICPAEITDIFVSEYIAKDGSREYQNLRFLSEKYAMLAADFINKDVFNIGGIFKNMTAIKMEKKDYDFKKSTEKSRMTLTIRYDYGATSTYKASKENCDYLRDIIRKYIIPNLK